MLGFEIVVWKDETVNDSVEEEYYMLMEHRIDIRELSLVISIIDDVLKANNLSPLTKDLGPNNSIDKISQSIEEHKQKHTN